jgi:hypothetical protein
LQIYKKNYYGFCCCVFQAHLDSEKNAVKDEKTKGKEEIVIFSDKLMEAILKGLIMAKEPKEHAGAAEPSTNVEAENEQWESEIGRIKSNLIDLIGPFHMVQLEWTNPFLTAMGESKNGIFTLLVFGNA